MKQLYIIIALSIAIIALWLRSEHFRSEAERFEVNYEAALSIYAKEKALVQTLTAKEAKQHFPDLVRDVEAATGTKIKKVESVITGTAHITTGREYVILRDTLTIHDTVRMGRVVYIKDRCIDHTVFFPDNMDTAQIDLSVDLDIVAAFTRERENKKGKRAIWPFGKKVSRGHLKVMCGEEAVQDSIIAIKFK
jgi:hypothetical protein